MPSPTGSEVRPWPSVVSTSFGSTRNASAFAARSMVPDPVIFTSGPTRLRSEVVACPFSMRNEAESCVRSVVCSLPSCHPASVEHGEDRSAQVRHDQALAVAGGAQRHFRLHLAVELVEVGRTPQQRQGADADEIAGERIARAAAGHIDDELARSLAAIDAEIRKAGFEHAGGDRRIDRNRRETRLADVEFGSGNPQLRVDIIQAGEIDRGIAPGLRSLRSGCGGLLRRRDLKPLKIEIEFYQWLAGE